MDESAWRRLLDLFGLSWKGYRRVRKGVQKRLARHIRQLGLEDGEAFLSLLEKDPLLREQTERLLAVSISRFFRDRALWQVLEEHVLPSLLQPGTETIKVWSAGCARGEEVYSFRILWEQGRKGREETALLELWGTDLKPEFLEAAREGIYGASSLKELSPELRAAYFRSLPGSRFIVSEFLKEGIRWKVHDLRRDPPPGTGWHILFLRNNLLTYYRGEIQKLALARILPRLAPGGFLMIGAHEKLPHDSFPLVPVELHPALFQKTA